MRILLCDDNEAFLYHFGRAIMTEFAQREITVDLRRCDGGARLLEEIDRSPADVVFLDIDMPEANGFTIAAQLSGRPQKPLLIFTTSMEDLVFDSFQFQPFWFLRKNHLEELPVVIDKLLAALRQGQHEYSVVVNDVTRRFLLDDILYFESKGHYILLHTAGDIHRFRAKLDDIVAQLNSPDFIRCHNSYYINCRYMKTLDKQNVTLRAKKEIIIPVSRSRWQDTQDAFFRSKGSLKQ